MNANTISAIASLIEAIVLMFVRRKKIRDIVLPLIEKAAADGTLPSNEARREYVVNYLMTQHSMTESTARLLVEGGIKLWKKMTDKKKEDEEKAAAKATKKAAKLAKG